jgi:hypothetical protein
MTDDPFLHDEAWRRGRDLSNGDASAETLLRIAADIEEVMRVGLGPVPQQAKGANQAPSDGDARWPRTLLSPWEF